jgi:uncharacterized protein (DUF2267 family)
MTTGLKTFDTTVEKANIWLHEIMKETGTQDRHRAYLALSSVLHALRDRLTVDETAHLGAQLPMLIRGLYYEGWDPSCEPIKHDRDSFLQYVRMHFREEPDLDAECIARAVFKVISKRIDEGEIREVKNILPKGLRQLWEPNPAQARC